MSNEGASVPLHELIDAVGGGDRRALSRLITGLVEHPDQSILSELADRRYGRHVTGITGPPGSGKSTLVDRLIGHYRSMGQRPGVILIDPSSPFTGGALLGDRVRMQAHSADSNVFMRSLATRGHLGGLALGADAVAMALDMAGFDPLLIETVGVGQSELDIVKLAHTVVVVLHPGWGDAVQANKAGLMEAGNVFVVNKSDQPGADRMLGEIHEMLAMSSDTDWLPPIVLTCAVKGEGIVELVRAIAAHRDHLNQK